MGWEDLSPKQQADWKKKNYNMGINVSQATVDAMNQRKTPEANFEYFKKNAPNAEQREGLNRFYGKSSVDSALGTSSPKPGDPGFVGPVYDPKLDPKNQKPPAVVKPGDPGFVGPVYDPKLDPKNQKPPGGTKGPQGSGTTTPVDTPRSRGGNPNAPGFRIPGFNPKVVGGATVGAIFGGPAGAIAGGLIGAGKLHLPSITRPPAGVSLTPGGRTGLPGAPGAPGGTAGGYMGGNVVGGSIKPRTQPTVPPSGSNRAPQGVPRGAQFELGKNGLPVGTVPSTYTWGATTTLNPTIGGSSTNPSLSSSQRQNRTSFGR